MHTHSISLSLFLSLKWEKTIQKIAIEREKKLLKFQWQVLSTFLPPIPLSFILFVDWNLNANPLSAEQLHKTAKSVFNLCGSL